MNLLLIKHARPLVDPRQPSHEWKLSEPGRRDCAVLAERLLPFSPTRVFHSDEPKAVETARIIAGTFGIPAEHLNDIFEHDRTNVPHMPSGEFISHVELFFRKPDELVLGLETATECVARFDAAVRPLPGEFTDPCIAVVTHGTVLALWLESVGAGRGFDLWRRMGLPSWAVVDTDGWKVTEIVEKL